MGKIQVKHDWKGAFGRLPRYRPRYGLQTTEITAVCQTATSYSPLTPLLRGTAHRGWVAPAKKKLVMQWWLGGGGGVGRRPLSQMLPVHVYTIENSCLRLLIIAVYKLRPPLQVANTAAATVHHNSIV